VRRRDDDRPGKLLGSSSHEIRDEIDFYLEERTRELEQTGFAPEEARRRAIEAFGDPQLVVERVQREWRGSRLNWGGRMITELWQDLKFTIRTLVREPVFALATGTTLALAIGANAAIFGIVDATLLRKPPVSDPESLVSVYTTCRAGDPRCATSYPDYLDYRAVGTLQDLAATTWSSVSAASPGESPQLLTALAVTGNYFDLLGVPPALGRLLRPADDVPGTTSPVAVLAFDRWRTSFGADPSVIGGTLQLNGTPHQIIGVAPQGFRGVALGGDPDLFLPLTSRDLVGVDPGYVPWEERDARWIQHLVGRLAPGASLDALQEELDALSAHLNEVYPNRVGRRITVDLSARYSLPTAGRDDLTRLVGVLSAVVALTLLLAAANVANLLLVRGGARQKEMGVRIALGSSTGRLMRQLLVESVTLAVIGGVAGLAVAALMLRALSGFSLPGGVPLEELGIGIDGRVFAFAVALSVVTGIAFGLMPALRAGRRDPVSSIRAGVQTSERAGDRLRKVLITAQVCACLVLLTGAGLFLRGLRSGLTYDLGMEPDGLVLARFDFSLLRYGPEEALLRVDEILERVNALPGVTTASVATTVPLQIGRNMGFRVEVDGYEPLPSEEMRVEMAFVTEDFFRTLGTEVLAGRELDGVAVEGEEPQLVINAEMANAYWRDGSPNGGIVRWRQQPLRVVGVTEDAAWRSVPQPPLNFITASLRQFPSFATNGTLTLIVRSSGDPATLLEPIRRAVLSVDPNLTFQSVEPMWALLGTHLSSQRLGTLLLTLFGGLAIVLAVVGIGGVVAYVVGRQQREIGIRIALGASSGQVQQSAMYGMLLPIAIGLGAGVLLAVRLGRSIQAFMIEASATDPGTYAAAAGMLALATLVAAWVPARRASKVDPARVLKAE
jgi:predicted permease